MILTKIVVGLIGIVFASCVVYFVMWVIGDFEYEWVIPITALFIFVFHINLIAIQEKNKLNIHSLKEK